MFFSVKKKEIDSQEAHPVLVETLVQAQVRPSVLFLNSSCDIHGCVKF